MHTRQDKLLEARQGGKLLLFIQSHILNGSNTVFFISNAWNIKRGIYLGNKLSPRARNVDDVRGLYGEETQT